MIEAAFTFLIANAPVVISAAALGLAAAGAGQGVVRRRESNARPFRDRSVTSLGLAESLPSPAESAVRDQSFDGSESVVESAPEPSQAPEISTADAGNCESTPLVHAGDAEVDACFCEPDYAAREIAMLAALSLQSGRSIDDWMSAIAALALRDRNALIEALRDRGLSYSEASWLERIFKNGGRNIYADARPAPKPPSLVAPRAQTRPRRLKPLYHVEDFLCHVRARRLGKNPDTGRREARRTDRGWVDEYHRWAEDAGLQVIPADTFLALMGEQPGVVKARDRLKDSATGRVLRNDHGTPLRATYYSVFMWDEAAAAKPQRHRAQPAVRDRTLPGTGGGTDKMTPEELLELRQAA